MYKLKKGNIQMTIFREEDAKEYIESGWKIVDDESNIVKTPIKEENVEETKIEESKVEEKIENSKKASKEVKDTFKKTKNKW